MMLCRFILGLAAANGLLLSQENVATRLLRTAEEARLASVQADQTSALRLVAETGRLLNQLAARPDRPNAIGPVRGQADERPTADAQAARNYLNQAETALRSRDFASAQNALFAFQSSSVLESAGADRLVLRARRNVAAARAAAGGGRWDEVAAALRAAAYALRDYRDRAPAPEARTADSLQSRLLTYADSVRSYHNNARDQLNRFWNELNAMMLFPDDRAPSPANAGIQYP